MRELIAKKLVIARKALKLVQMDVVNDTGLSQAAVSAIETGKYTFIPSAYLIYLASKGVNLTALFDMSTTAEVFEKVVTQDYHGHTRLLTEPCNNCAEKDKVIEAKNEVIGLLRERISYMDAKNERYEPTKG